MKKYVFKPYNKIFPKLFSCEKKRIISYIPECLDIQHVGSTAVPKLGGKGIIDIAIAVEVGDFALVVKKLKDLGYEFRESGSTSERLFFKVFLPDKIESKRQYHIHLTSLESKEWKNLLAFRDYLRTHLKAVKEYENIKKKASDKANEDGLEYRRLKTHFFEAIFEKTHKERR